MPEERKLLAELLALEKPEGDQDEIDRIWAARKRGVDALEEAARSPESALAYLAVDDAPEGFDESEQLASVYGMVNCSAAHPGSVAG